MSTASSGLGVVQSATPVKRRRRYTALPVYILRRLGRSLSVGLAVSLVAFGLLRLIPGDPVAILLGDSSTPELIKGYRERLGLSGSVWDQLISYFSGVFHGNLGVSIITGQPVMTTIAHALPATLWLVGTTMTFTLIIATALALTTSLSKRAWVTHAFRIGTTLSISMPTFFVGLVAILLISVKLGWAPVAGYEPGFPGNFKYLWLPALVIGANLVPVFSRVLLSSITDTLEQEFVETGIVHGIGRRTWTWRYVLRPSMPTTVSLLGYVTGQLLGSAVIVEMIFNIPGVGTELVRSVGLRDYPMVQGIVLVFGLIVVIVNFLGEMANRWLDARVRVS